MKNSNLSKSKFYLKDSEFVDNVVKIINYSNVNTLCVNGDWGSGKSYFCKELKNKLCAEDDGICVLSVNCFDGEIYNDPLMSLLDALNSYFIENAEVNRVSDALMAGAKTIFEIGINVAVKKAFGEDVKDISDRCRNNYSKSKENMESKEYRTIKNIWNSFTSELVKLAEGRRIVFILDELDRCRPDYAIAVLETVKHFFCVSGVKFVYSVCLTGLKKSIVHVYGEIDSALYLEKFFDFQVDIPVAVKNDGTDVARAYRYFVDLIDEISVTSPDEKIVFKKRINRVGDIGGVGVNVFEDFINKHHVSMRGVERFVRYVDVSRFIVPISSEKHSILYYFALLIVVFFREQIDFIITEYSGSNDADVAQIISDAIKVDIDQDDATGWLLANIRELSKSSFEGQQIRYVFFDTLNKLSTVK